MNEPSRLVSGSSVQWKTTVPSDYATGHTLLYEFQGLEGTWSHAESTQEGAVFTVDLSTSDTAQAPGGYQWNLFAVKSGVKVRLESGWLDILPETTRGDHRSHVKKVLDALNATLERRATSDQLQVTINTPTGSQTIQRSSLDELITARDKYEAMWKAELDAEKLAGGSGNPRLIYTRFSEPI